MVYQVVRENDGSMRFLYVSAGVERLNGLSVDEVLRDPGTLYRQIVEEDRQKVATAEEESMKSMGMFNTIARLRRTDGQLRWMHLSSSPRRLEDGRILWDGIQIDITERMQAEEALQKAHDELEHRVEERTIDLRKANEQLLHAKKLAAIGNLSASIAHEFNNPLQGVMNIIKGVARRAKLDEDDTELMTMAIGECKRMRDLIKSLQDFNRPTSGRKAPMNVHTALDSLLVLGKKEYKTRGITLEKRYAENIPQINAVADQIKQVFLNLLNNAANACPEGGTITVETETLREKVIVRIHDTGVGIKPEDKGHIFEPFFSTKPEVKGTGLGLSISYGIVREHGGEITLNSEPGKGATFSVILPIEGGENAYQENPVG